MAEGNQIVPVDNIVEDDRKLEEKATQLFGEDLEIESEITGRDFELVDPLICAILVKKQGAAGAVRVFASNDIRNVVTGPNEVGSVIVAVRTDKSEYCRILGTPSVRYFRRRRP